MNYKKFGAVIAASLFLIAGLTIYGSKFNGNTNNPQTPPSSSPMEGEQYTPNEEFINFNIDKIKKNVSKIELRNHTNTHTFKIIENNIVINSMVTLLADVKEKEMTNEIYEKIAKSQSDGNSVTVRFILNDGTISSVRVNLDLDIICINEKYHTVSSELVKEIQKELNTVDNFNDINRPAPGM